MSNENNNNKNIINIKIRDDLDQKKIVNEYYYHISTKSVKISLNHKYQPTVNATFRINIDEWDKNAWKINKILGPRGIDPTDIQLLEMSLDDTWEEILNSYNNSTTTTNTNYQDQQQQQQYQATKTIDIPFSEWSIKLVEKYQSLQRETSDLIPELWEPLEFALSVRSILRIKNITLPFAGIVLGPSSSLKTTTVELFRYTNDTYYTDNFSAKAFVSHNTAIPKEELKEVDLLPKIKDKLFLTPELSPTFSKKEDELNEILGIITRVLDGHGYESDTGAQGHRGYTGNYRFMWIGAAVDIPRKVYKLLGTLGPKLYFFRMKVQEKDENDYLKQNQDEDIKGDFSKKIEKIKSKLNDYLDLFDSQPIDYEENINKNIIIEEKVLLRIIRLALLLRHLRGNVPVWETKDSQGSDYAYTSASLEDPNRAITQLKNLARGHALLQGRNNVTIDDIPVLIKVVLSTASKERVILFDHLLENNGQLDTMHIADHMMISKNTALRTMAEFHYLKLVDRLEMQNSNPNDNKSFQIQLKDKFEWFLTPEFKELRKNFGKEYHDEYVKSKQEKQQQQSLDNDDKDKDE